MARRVDALVIGAGPGGYVCALRLAQLGRSTLLVERDRLGGECLNYGCIPSKALIHASTLVDRVRHGEALGIRADVKVDMAQMQKWKASVVERLTGGIVQLCKGYGVEVLYGEASFRDVQTVEVRAAHGTPEVVEARAIVVATGSHPAQLPGLEYDGQIVVDSKDALRFPSLPKRFLVVGGGITGLEIATMYAKLGSEVTVVELLERLLPGYPGIDDEISRSVARGLKQLKVKYYTSSTVKALERKPDGATAKVETPEGELKVEVDRVLVSVGRKPTTEGLDLKAAGVAVDAKGFIPVDEHLRTNVPNVYAIGDVTGVPFLAHRASYQGKVAAEVIAGLPAAVDITVIPSAVFTDPEIGYAGLTEEEARAQGHRPIVGKFPFAALGRALAMAEPEGYVKVVADAESQSVLGVQIVGPEAADLISEVALAMEMGATVEDIALTIHPHPTLPEAILEAAEATLGKSVHIVRK